MFRTLTLKNFKRHEHLVVDFTAGLNGIFGANYKGKSSLLYALLYALGGASHVPGTRLARRGSDGRFSVELAFDLAGASYTVTRTKSTANLFRAGAEDPLATGTTGVNDKIEELIGMSVKQWKELHYAKQKNAHSLLRYSANNLHSLMRRLVGAEELDQIQQRIKRMLDKEEGLVEALGQSSFTLEECQDQLDKASAAICNLETSLILAEQEVQDLQTFEQNGLDAIQKATQRLQQAQKQLGLLQTYAARYDAASRGVGAAAQELEQRAQARQQAAQALEKAQADADPEAEEKIRAYEGLKAQLAQVEIQAKNAARRLEQAAQAKEKAAQATAAAEAAYTAASQELGADTLAARLTAAEEDHEKAKQACTLNKARVNDIAEALKGSACPTCQRPFEQHDPDELKRELALAKAREADSGDWLADSKGLLDSLQQAQKKLLALSSAQEKAVVEEGRVIADWYVQKAAAENASGELATATADLEKAGIDDQVIGAMRAAANQVVEAWSAAKAAEGEEAKAAQALESAREALLKLGEHRPEGEQGPLETEIGKLEAQLNKDRATLVEVREALSAARGTVEELRRSRATEKGVEKTWSERLERLKGEVERRDAAMKRAARLKHLQKHLKDNAEGYMGKVWASFMAQASRFASQCTGGDIQGLERSDDGAFTFLEEEEVMQLEDASGAQEAIIGLAVQMALSEAAPCNLQVLLLDEPTADMDPNCSMATMAAMKALGQQVIFVSHQPDDNSLCDNAITL